MKRWAPSLGKGVFQVLGWKVEGRGQERAAVKGGFSDPDHVRVVST